MGNAGRPGRQMSPSESGASSLDAEFALPLRLKEIFPQLRRGRPEEVAGVLCETLNGLRPGQPLGQTLLRREGRGLLVRMVRYADTPLGRNPTQIDYSDISRDRRRESALPLDAIAPQWTLHHQIAEAKGNVPVDDAKFNLPAGSAK